jgi:hypothetical protein
MSGSADISAGMALGMSGSPADGCFHPVAVLYGSRLVMCREVAHGSFIRDIGANRGERCHREICRVDQPPTASREHVSQRAFSDESNTT